MCDHAERDVKKAKEEARQLRCDDDAKYILICVPTTGRFNEALRDCSKFT
jgi:hypothetical protein